jgi:hypothetical protein
MTLEAEKDLSNIAYLFLNMIFTRYIEVKGKIDLSSLRIKDTT